ncbi:heme exporter protein CcmD [Ancylobacter terrae]|uniref:heme exporter protein CcmD n=1 Tax=Ancylobacter sp. sgz301288 TaxID=3342077 RepID=UPI00385B67BE
MADQHGFFILAAYLGAALVLMALALKIAVDGRAVRRALAELEARGITRRSAARDVEP